MLSMPVVFGLDFALYGLTVAGLIGAYSQNVGGWYVAWSVVTMLAGRFLMYRRRDAALPGRSLLRLRRLPTPAQVTALVDMYAAMALMLPGWISDLVGLLLLIPPLGRLVSRRYHAYLATRLEPNVVDGDFEEVKRPALSRSDRENS